MMKLGYFSLCNFLITSRGILLEIYALGETHVVLKMLYFDDCVVTLSVVQE